MQEGVQNPLREDLLIGFSLSATYLAAAVYLLTEGYPIFAGIIFISGILCLTSTYVLAYFPGKIMGRVALAVAIVPLIFSPFLVPRLLLIYPAYRFGRYCLSPVLGSSKAIGLSHSILKDTFVFLPVLACCLFVAVINPEYLYELRYFPENYVFMIVFYVFLLCVISMAFLAAARLRERKYTFQKVAAFLFSVLFSVIAAFVFIMAPAAATMSNQLKVQEEQSAQ